MGQSDIVVSIPLVLARAKNKVDYIVEMEAAGFVVDEFIEMDINMHAPIPRRFVCIRNERI